MHRGSHILLAANTSPVIVTHAKEPLNVIVLNCSLQVLQRLVCIWLHADATSIHVPDLPRSSWIAILRSHFVEASSCFWVLVDQFSACQKQVSQGNLRNSVSCTRKLFVIFK